MQWFLESIYLLSALGILMIRTFWRGTAQILVDKLFLFCPQGLNPPPSAWEAELIVMNYEGDYKLCSRNITYKYNINFFCLVYFLFLMVMNKVYLNIFQGPWGQIHLYFLTSCQQLPLGAIGWASTSFSSPIQPVHLHVPEETLSARLSMNIPRKWLPVVSNSWSCTVKVISSNLRF